MQLVRQRHPGVQVDVQFIGNDAMKLGLNNFSLDVGVTYMDTADLGRRNALPICTERLSLLVPDTEPFRDRTTISWKEAAELPLAGKTFVLTGTLPSMTRDEATAKIESLGGHVTSSVSKKTDYVLAGADPGSKIDQAKELGVRILSEPEFRKMLGS